MEQWTISKILTWSIDFFKKKDIPNPKLSSEILLSDALHISRLDLYLKYNYVLNKKELSVYREYVKKRLEHVPVQYILKKAFFRKIKLHVDENVLIPRPETEILVDSAIRTFKIVKDRKKTINMLEVGTGSGAIPLSMSTEINDMDEVDKKSWKMISTEKNKDSYDIAIKNFSKLQDCGFSENIEFYNCDVVPGDDEFLEKYRGNIQLIISNPPYISSDNYVMLPREIKEYEPESALHSGKTGLEIYERILSKIKPFIDKDICYIEFEIDPNASKSLTSLLEKTISPEEINIIKDYNNRDRVAHIKV